MKYLPLTATFLVTFRKGWCINVVAKLPYMCGTRNLISFPECGWQPVMTSKIKFSGRCLGDYPPLHPAEMQRNFCVHVWNKAEDYNTDVQSSCEMIQHVLDAFLFLGKHVLEGKKKSFHFYPSPSLKAPAMFAITFHEVIFPLSFLQRSLTMSSVWYLFFSCFQEFLTLN